MCPSCLKLYYCRVGGNKRCDQTIRHGRLDAGAFSRFSGRKEELFLLFVPLLQNFFEIYIISASEGIMSFLT